MQFKKIEEHMGPSNFIKLKDRESVVGVFVGEPFEFYSVYENQKPRIVSENTQGAKFRFRINFVVKDGPTFTPKIFENSATVYRQLDELNTEYDGLENIYVKITRNGEKLETTYSILPSKQQIKKEELAHIKTLELHDLNPTTNEQEKEINEDEIPF